MADIAAYPLHWPAGWRRTDPDNRKEARFRASVDYAIPTYQRRVTMAVARQRLLRELDALHVEQSDVVVSSNVPVRLDGWPRAGAREPTDPGVAVYWRTWRGPQCMAIDQYRRAADNLAAVAATLEYLRGVARHGGAQVLDRAFTGFTALPSADSGTAWWQVLMVRPDATVEDINAAFRELAAGAHPDRGGSHACMATLNRARAEGLAARRCMA